MGCLNARREPPRSAKRKCTPERQMSGFRCQVTVDGPSSRPAIHGPWLPRVIPLIELAREGIFPQGLKPFIYALVYGTAEAVPFQNPI